jgi:dipeptidyl aminopeptidase/acylaminoacyl peptidase
MGEVQAVVDVCGPSDFFDPAWRPEHWELLGGTVLEKPQLARLASPAHQISVDAADFLILHGATDLEVPLSQAERLHTALLKAGAQSELVIFPDGDHFINETHKPQIEKLALEFFCKTLGDPL